MAFIMCLCSVSYYKGSGVVVGECCYPTYFGREWHFPR